MLMAGGDCRESLSRYRPRVFVDGERVEDIAVPLEMERAGPRRAGYGPGYLYGAGALLPRRLPGAGDAETRRRREAAEAVDGGGVNALNCFQI